LNRDLKHLLWLSKAYLVTAVVSLCLGGLLIALAALLALLLPEPSRSINLERFTPFASLLVLGSGLLAVLSLAYGVGLLLTGRYLIRQQHYNFCLVFSGLNCLVFPFGVVLGLLTLLVLQRPSVQHLFTLNRLTWAAPFHRGMAAPDAEAENLRRLKRQEWVEHILKPDVLGPLILVPLLCLGAAALAARTYVAYGPTSYLVWRYKANATIVSAPVVDDSSVYFGSLGDPGPPGFRALDKRNGTLLWHVPTDADVFYWVPSVVDGLVAFSTDDGYFIALDAQTGAEQWRFSPAERSHGEGCDRCKLKFRPATAVDGVIYVGSLDHHLYALDARTGQKQWRFAAGDSFMSAPVLAGGLLYAGSMDGNVYVLNAATGEEMKRFATGRAVYDLTIEDDTLYLANAELAALDRVTGLEKWRFSSRWQDRDTFTKTPIVAGELVYAMTFSRLYAVDKRTGEEVWQYGNIKGSVFQPFTLAGGRIYFGDTDSYLYVVDAQSGRLYRRYNLAHYDRASRLNYTAEFVFSPAVAAGVIYVGWFEHLYALEAQ
jgi:outer membrane protein assembly factor BamB